jgi:hypothetical protein
MLRTFTLAPTAEPGERWRSRGVANAPAKGGVAVVRRRAPVQPPAAAAAAPQPATQTQPAARRTPASSTALGARP